MYICAYIIFQQNFLPTCSINLQQNFSTYNLFLQYEEVTADIILTRVCNISTSTEFSMTQRFTFIHTGVIWIVLIISQWIIQCNRIKTISHTIVCRWFCSFNLWYIKLFVWINQPLPVGTNISFTCTYIYVHMAVIIVLLLHWSVQKPSKAWCIVNSPGHILQIWLLCFIQN